MNRTLNVGFAGTPEFARVALAKLIAAGYPVHLVLTQPDRPAGRGMKLQASPVKQLAQQHGKDLEPHEQDCNLQLGSSWLRWERHNEFSTYTFIRTGTAPSLFCDPQELVPDHEWFASLPGQLFRVVQLSIVQPAQLATQDPTELFVSEHLISSMVFNGKARIWTDFRKHNEGAGRMLVLDNGLSRSALGALVQQLFDLGNYRKLALLAWPYCKQALHQLPQQEQQLAVIMNAFDEDNDGELTVKELRKRLPEIMTHTPDMPRLVHAWLRQQVEGGHELSMRSQDLVALNTNLQKLQKRAVAAIAGVGLMIVAAVLYGLQPGGWYFGDAPVWSWVTGAAGVFSLASAWWRR